MKQGKRHEVVVITGASAGLGRATARLFAEKGAHLGLIARGQGRLDAVRNEVQALGARALTISADVADAEELDRAAARIEAELGPIDVWINSAMTTVFSPFQEITPEDYRRVTEVTYLGQVHGTMAALKRMRERDRGVIVHVGSALAHRSIPLQTAYCGAKHAIKGFTEALRSELIHDGSRVHLSLVEMPALNTPQFDWCKSHLPHQARPVAPVYQPEVGARAIYWAAHHRRRELYVGVASPLTVWGNRLAPKFMDRYLARTAIGGQQTSDPVSPAAPNNLWQPLTGDPGARGRFDSESYNFSPQLWFTTNRAVGLAAAAALLFGAAALCGSIHEDQRGSDRRRLT